MMTKTFFKILFTLVFVFAIQGTIQAQMPDASSADGRSGLIKEKDLPETMKENLAKQRIKSEEKEYQELLARSEEAAKLGEELNHSLENNQSLKNEDLKKLDRLEKIVKKIRNDLGAEEDKSETEPETPENTATAVKIIKEDTANLLSEIKRIGRHTISVIAIKSSNSLLNMVKFLRFNKN